MNPNQPPWSTSGRRSTRVTVTSISARSAMKAAMACQALGRVASGWSPVPGLIPTSRMALFLRRRCSCPPLVCMMPSGGDNSAPLAPLAAGGCWGRFRAVATAHAVGCDSARTARLGGAVSVSGACHSLRGMLEGLGAVDWAALEHAYGSAGDVPELIRALRDRDPEVRNRALWQLWGNIYHQ